MLEFIMSLLLLISSMTGIDRQRSDVLMNLAQQRSSEIVTNFNHRSLPELSTWNWGEIIGWNSGTSDPVTAIVNAWRNSPEHWKIMTDPAYQQVGCGLTISGIRYYFACIFGTNSGQTITTIPNTAMKSH